MMTLYGFFNAPKVAWLDNVISNHRILSILPR